MAEAFYRLKSAGGAWTRVTGTAPITVTGLTEGAVYEYLRGDGTIAEVTAGVTATLTVPAAMSAPSLTGGTESATLTLGPAPDDGNDPITNYGYEVTESADTGFASPVAQGTQTPANLGTAIDVSPLTAGDYIARQRATNSTGTGSWSSASAAATVQAATTNIPTYTINNITGDTMSVSVGDDTSTTLSLYHILDQSGTAPTSQQVKDGQDSTGAAAILSQGPDMVSTGLVDVEIDMTGVADGTYNIRGVSVDDLGNISLVDSETFDLIKPFVDDFNRANEPLEASADWDLVWEINSGSLDVDTNHLSMNTPVANGGAGCITTETKPADQYAESELIDAVIGSGGSKFISLYVRAFLQSTELLGISGYRATFRCDRNDVFLYSISNATVTEIGSNINVRVQVGDIMRIQAVGDNIEVLRNGQVVISVTDTTHASSGASGVDGFNAEAGENITIDNFRHGAI